MSLMNTAYETLKEVASLSGDAVVIYNLTAKAFAYINTAFFEVLQLDQRTFRTDNDTVMDLIIPSDREFVRRQFRAVIEQKTVREIEFRCQRGADILTVRCNAYLIANKTLVIATLRNITEPKVHEDYLVEFGIRKNTILDNLVHQISGALTLMKDLSSEASKAVRLEEGQRVGIYLQLLHDNSQYCLEIINDLLRKEHERSPSVSVKNSRVDLIAKVNIIYSELTETDKTHVYHFHRNADVLFVNTDEVKLLQVINNLASNALKFSPEGSPITLNVQDEGDTVLISVKDLGIGIPDEWQTLVFKRNSGVGRPGLRGERSIGIGLSICKNLVDLLSGTIWFESREGEGSTFFIRLPKE